MHNKLRRKYFATCLVMHLQIVQELRDEAGSVGRWYRPCWPTVSPDSIKKLFFHLIKQTRDCLSDDQEKK